jgi:hypothetical protein
MTRFHIDHAVGTSVRVSFEGSDLFTYVYAPDTLPIESPKPYLHPIHTLDGRLISLFRPHDHVWHKGIAWSLADVGDDNFWGGPTYVRDRGYVQLDNNGRVDHDTLIRLERSDDGVDMAHRLRWIAQDDRQVFAESRSLAVRLVGDADGWALVFDTAMTNTSDAAIAMGSPTTRGRENAGYGGLTWRGPRSFDNGIIHTPAGSSRGEEARGTHHEWLGFSGRHDGTARWSTIVMVDSAQNPRHPTAWFVRNEAYAMLGTAPFFNEELVVAPGETLRFRYAVVIADGHDDHADVTRLAGWGLKALEAAPVSAAQGSAFAG